MSQEPRTLRGMECVFDLAGGGRCHGCGATGTLLCEGCFRRAAPAGEEDLPGVGRTLCAWRYTGAPRSLVLGLKLRARKACSGPLESALQATILRHGVRGDTLTWVPARRGDIRRRGFDHAEVLARGLGKRSGLQVRPLLRRTGASRDQTQLTRSERFDNLARAFSASSCRGGVIVVDDLVTTGATARSCSAALEAAGASAVEVLAACRA